MPDPIKLAEDVFNDIIRKQARIARMPSGYIENTKITRNAGGISVKVDYKTDDGKPLDKFLDLGTKGHFVRPKRPDGVLAFDIGGTTVFSKKHWVRGLKPKHVLENSLKEFKRVYPQEVRRLYNGTTS